MYFFYNDRQQKIEVTTYRELRMNLAGIEGIAQSEDDPFVFEFDKRFLVDPTSSMDEPESGFDRFAVRVLALTTDFDCIVYGIAAGSLALDEVLLHKVGQQMLDVDIRPDISLLSPQEDPGRQILDNQLEILRSINEA